MPCGGVPKETGNEDGEAGALHAPACPRHRGDAGGRKLPPPTVRQVQHAGPLEGDEWAPRGDRAVCKRGGEKETTARRDGDKGELRAGFRIIRSIHLVGVGVQIHWEDLDGNRLQLAGGGQESQEGKAKLGTSGQGA